MKGFLYHTAAAMRREIGRIARMRMYRMLLFYLPLAAFAFFALFFSKGVPRNIPIAVVDDDRTALSRKLVEMLDAAPTAYVAYVAPSMNEAERLMREGEIMAVVLIPSDFEKELLGGVPTPVEAYITGTNITVNGLLSKDIQTVVTTFSAGVQLQLLTVRGMSDEQAMAQIMPVRFNRHVLFNPYINYGYYLAPSFMPMMLLIFAVMATVFAVGTELKHGTAREWLNAGGDLMTAALTGKLLPVTDAAVAGFRDAVHSDSNRRRTTERKLYCHAGRNVLFFARLSGDCRIDCRLDGQHALVAFVERRVFGLGVHFFGTDIPDYGDVGANALAESVFPVHLLYRSIHRPDDARSTGRLFAVRFGIYGAVHAFAIARAAAVAQSLHGAEILGEGLI